MICVRLNNANRRIPKLTAPDSILLPGALYLSGNVDHPVNRHFCTDPPSGILARLQSCTSAELHKRLEGSRIPSLSPNQERNSHSP